MSNKSSSACSLYLNNAFRKAFLISRSPACVPCHPGKRTRRTFDSICCNRKISTVIRLQARKTEQEPQQKRILCDFLWLFCHEFPELSTGPQKPIDGTYWGPIGCANTRFGQRGKFMGSTYLFSLVIFNPHPQALAQIGFSVINLHVPTPNRNAHEIRAN